jgi:hypothetical protein
VWAYLGSEERLPETFLRSIESGSSSLSRKSIISSLPSPPAGFAYIPLFLLCHNSYTTHFTLHPLFALYHSTSSSKRPQTLADAFSFVASNIDHRQALMLLTQTIWSFRLSWNAWRRGFFDPRR